MKAKPSRHKPEYQQLPVPPSAPLSPVQHTARALRASISTDASVAAASSTAAIQADSKFNYKRRLEVYTCSKEGVSDNGGRDENSSPRKVESLKATNESKRTAKKVKKLSKSLQEKTEMERTVS